MPTTDSCSAKTTAVDLGRAVLAEWTKFRSVRSSFWSLLTAVVLTVGIGAGFVPFLVDSYERRGTLEPGVTVAPREGWWFAGLHFGILGITILGVLFASSEYSTGTIRATLAAVPTRSRVLAAKILAFAAITLVTGLVQSYAAFIIAKPILADRSIHISATDHAVLRGVAMATLALAGAGLFGLGVGLLVRHTAGAIGAVIGVLWVLTGLALLLPASWSDLVNVLPAEAMYAMFTPTARSLEPGPATGVFFGYVTLTLAIAGGLFVRRDA